MPKSTCRWSCRVFAQGKVLKEAKVASEPGALVTQTRSPHLSTFRTVFRDTFGSRAISLIVLPFDEVLAPNPRNRLHDQHP